MPNNLTDINLLDILPSSIKDDPDVKAAAQAIQNELNAVSNLCFVPAIYSRLDQLNSQQLDHIAWQFDSKIWRDSWPINIKRSVIRSVITEKMKMGTRAIVEEAVESMGSAIEITEWFEMTPRGVPHTFDVQLTVSEIPGQTSDEVQDDLIRRINNVKPARSHFTLSIATQAFGNIYLGGAVRAANYARLNCIEQI